MDKPIIGISGSEIIDNGGIFPGYRRSYVNEDYVDSVVKMVVYHLLFLLLKVMK